MNSPPSSLTQSLSVVVSREDDSMSSEGYSPRSRDEDSFWEKRRRTGDFGQKRRTVEKRHVSDVALEQRLLALSQENELLKCRLESRTAVDSLLGGPLRSNVLGEVPAMPAPSVTPSLLNSQYGAPTSVITSRFSSTSTASSQPHASTSASAANLPMLQLAHLQAAIQQQLQLPQRFPVSTSSSSSSPLFSSSSAFQPFQSVIKRSPERIMPDSSTEYPHLRVLTSKTTSSHPSTSSSSPLIQSTSSNQGGLLSAILSSRTSPNVPRTSTEHWSGLSSPPRDHAHCSSSSKSDNESAASSSSLSPSGSGRSSHSGDIDPKRQAYMDRRKRNNEAAKRCRANRRAVFEYRSRRVQVLENENDQLRDEITSLRREIESYKSRLIERGSSLPLTPSTVITLAPPTNRATRILPTSSSSPNFSSN